jgi:hypothetical protein
MGRIEDIFEIVVNCTRVFLFLDLSYHIFDCRFFFLGVNYTNKLIGYFQSVTFISKQTAAWYF